MILKQTSCSQGDSKLAIDKLVIHIYQIIIATREIESILPDVPGELDARIAALRNPKSKSIKGKGKNKTRI